MRTALLGEPDPENVQRRLDNGWTFVNPAAHPGAPKDTTEMPDGQLWTLEKAIGFGGLVLMQRPTLEVQAQHLREQEEIESRYPILKVVEKTKISRDDPEW